MTVTKIIKNYIPHDKLSSKLWDDVSGKMKPDIREKLLIIADVFVEYLGVPIDVLDVTVTGSYANYNYTPYSDIDLHIIVDYDDLTSVEDLSKEFFHAKKSFWNDRHDIKIKGIEVELYAQDNSEPHSSSGVYSVDDDDWLVLPKKFKTDIDQKAIKNKYKKLKVEIEEAIKEAQEDNSTASIDRMLKKVSKPLFEFFTQDLQKIGIGKS